MPSQICFYLFSQPFHSADACHYKKFDGLLPISQKNGCISINKLQSIVRSYDLNLLPILCLCHLNKLNFSKASYALGFSWSKCTQVTLGQPSTIRKYLNFPLKLSFYWPCVSIWTSSNNSVALDHSCQKATWWISPMDRLNIHLHTEFSNLVKWF